MNVAVRLSSVRELDLSTHPYLPLYQELPTAPYGYVYLLVSLSEYRCYFVGEGQDLKSAFRDHNTGHGYVETRDTQLQPWAVYAFITGFDAPTRESARDQRIEFATQWRSAISMRGLTADDVYLTGRQLAERANDDGLPVVIVKCGETVNVSMDCDNN